MASISNAISHFPGIQHLAQGPSFTANSNQLQVRSQTQSQTNFSFVTAEGDRVSLSRASEVTSSFGTYSFQGVANGQTVSLEGQQFRSSIQQDFHLLVEGDLNEQEQADIQTFLNSANNIFHELAKGNTEEASKAALSLGNLNTLSQAALFVRQSTSVTVATQSTGFDVQPANVNNGSQSENQSEQEGPGILEQVLSALQNAREQLQLNSEQLAIRVPNLIPHLLESLQEQDKEKESEPSIFDNIRKEFIQSLLDTTNLLNTTSHTTDVATKEPQGQDNSNPSLTHLLDETSESVVEPNSSRDDESLPHKLTNLHV